VTMQELKSRRGTYRVPHLMRWRDRKGWPEQPATPLVGPDTKIAAIGSCFAERITEYLEARGLPTTFHPAGLQYNTFAIRQEFEHLFGDSGYSDDDVVLGDDGVHEHLFRKEFRSTESKQAVLDMAAAGDAVARAAYTEADLIVITLGLTEIWQRDADGLVAVELPPAPAHRAGGWTFRSATVAENIANLERTYALLKQHTTAQILITVSPVPLGATFRPDDIIVANCASKSRLRAALADFLLAHPDVHTFHSYELVAQWQGEGTFFEEDGRHVNPQGVAFIMNEFLRMYGKDGMKAEFVPFGSVAMPDQTLERRFSRLKSKVATKVRRMKGLEG